MLKLNFVLSSASLLLSASFVAGPSVFAQGFDNYAAPQAAQTKARPVQQSRAAAPAQVAPQGAAPKAAPQVAPQVAAQQATAPAPQAQAQSGSESRGGYIGNENMKNALADPPANYNPTEAELAKLDEFLAKWEEHGKNIKRVMCDVHVREFDSLLQQDAKRPVSHTFGEFRFIMPNKLSYHIKGEFDYTDPNTQGVWKDGQNEWQVVLDGKSFTQYDFKEKKAHVFPIPEEERDIDLTMDNGQFPLFFVAKAQTLKSRFYLRIVTPASKQQDQVWIEAFPRYTRDAQQFKSIIVGLELKTLQPSFMRKYGANGKSRTELAFSKVELNKSLTRVEASIPIGWVKQVHDEPYSLIGQQTIVTENGTQAILVTDPAKFPSNKTPEQQAEKSAKPNAAKTPAAQTKKPAKR